MTHIFVFGSNLAGIHGAGSAKHALKYCGAVYGIGIGMQGNSYAIPTKNEKFEVLSLCSIKIHVDDFIVYAQEHLKDTFNIVAIGCGLAGYKAEEIAPMFQNAPNNCNLPVSFENILKGKA